MKLQTIYVWLQEQDSCLDSQIEKTQIQLVYLKDQEQLCKLDAQQIRTGLLLTDDVEALKRTDMSYVILLNQYSLGKTLPEGAYCVEALKDIDAEYFVRIYQRKHGLPWNILETKRLRIREITLQDVDALEALYADEEVTRYMETLFPHEKELEYTQNYITYVYGFYGYGMWIVEEKESHQIIGRVGLESKEGFEGLELGFMLGKPYWNHGYATEMCKAVLEYGIEQLEVFSYRALVEPQNERSIRLCERLGFIKHGMQGSYIEMRKEECTRRKI